MKTVTFLVSTPVQADTAVVWAHELAARSFRTEMVAPSTVISSIGSRVFDRVDRMDAATIRRSTYVGQLASIATPSAFSPAYNRARNAAKAGTARAATARVLGCRRATATGVNRMLDRARRRSMRRNRVTLVLSIANYPGYLDRSPVMTLTESWDHPRSRPACYLSDTVAAWNQDIADDWQEYQGASDTVVGYPTKLRYAIESPVRHFERREGAAILYAATSSSNTPQGWLFDEELELIAALAKATAWAGLKLLVKPKPNGRPGEFDAVKERFRNVSVSRYGEAPGAADYRLGVEYNQYRLRELDASDAVVNVGTTFALDAAAAGVPVLQLDLRGRDDLPQLAAAQKAYHISRYLLGAETVARVTPGEQLHIALRSALTRDHGSAAKFGSTLQGWLRSAGDFGAAAARVAHRLDDLLT